MGPVTQIFLFGAIKTSLQVVKFFGAFGE
jgi:hypothetical protein